MKRASRTNVSLLLCITISKNTRRRCRPVCLPFMSFIFAAFVHPPYCQMRLGKMNGGHTGPPLRRRRGTFANKQVLCLTGVNSKCCPHHSGTGPTFAKRPNKLRTHARLRLLATRNAANGKTKGRILHCKMRPSIKPLAYRLLRARNITRRRRSRMPCYFFITLVVSAPFLTMSRPVAGTSSMLKPAAGAE